MFHFLINYTPFLMNSFACSFDSSTQLSKLKKTKQKQESAKKPQHAIICMRCQTVITYPSHNYFYMGEHQHTFINPHGLVFEIALYSETVCVKSGSATQGYTWFPGYAWQIAHCPNCQDHLGWSYTCLDKPSFYGLILDRIATGEL